MLRNRRENETDARSRGTVRRCARLNGHELPRQLSVTTASLGATRTTSVCSRVKPFATAQRLVTSAGTTRQDSARRSQFSSTALPRISSAPGRIAALPSSQSTGTAKPSRSTSRLTSSRPLQSSSTPLPKTSGAPGRIAALASLQSTVVAKPSLSLSTPVSHSAMMSVKSLVTVSVPAPQAIRSAVPSLARIVSLPASPK